MPAPSAAELVAKKQKEQTNRKVLRLAIGAALLWLLLYYLAENIISASVNDSATAGLYGSLSCFVTAILAILIMFRMAKPRSK
jgi:hypothetical protein